MKTEWTQWRKSSRSNGNGGNNCLECRWRKSSKSGTVNCVEWRKSTKSGSSSCVEWRKRCGNGECVEVCTCHDVQVRDSKDKTGPVLGFTPTDWQLFVNWVACLQNN